MKRTVIFEFPDDFKFPEYFGQENMVEKIVRRCEITGEIMKTELWKKSTCFDCPFHIAGGGYGEELQCYLTGDFEGQAEEKRHACPFCGGADTVNYD